MGEDVKSKLVDVVSKFISKAVIELPTDVVEALRNAYRNETIPFTKKVYEAYFTNLKIAKLRRSPLCQDTGVLTFFVKVGTKSPFLDLVNDVLIEATRKATFETPLRPNAVDPFTGVNSGDNTGVNTPFIDIELVPGSDRLEIYLYIAGGGSSLPGAAKVFTPGEGLKAVKEFVIDTVVKYGPNACPPLIVGVGIGATAEIAMILSKKALLRKVGDRNPNPRVAELEEELKKDLNELGIGAQGLGGRISVLDVFVEYAYRHPATYAAGVSIGCWAHRRGLLIIYPNLRFETPYHGGDVGGA